MSDTQPTGTTARAARHWESVTELFERALAQPDDERHTWLRATCADATICSEVEALLAAHDRRGVLDELVDAVMTPMLPSRTPLVDAAVLLPAHARYRVIERIGGGGMGVVYRARDERLDRDIALKFLPPHLSADADAKRRFLVEARAAAAIEHPNICTVHEIGDTDDGRLYIVMACYDGETLDRTISRGPLPVQEALRIATEIARGLAKAHERGIVHRDIKPANVMVTADGLVKILDFGIAKLANVATTQTVGAIGTVAYMSPEQAFGETVDHRTDIWSLGVVMYEMFTGVRPFRGPGDQAVLVAALSADPVSLVSERADVPPAVDALVRRALAKRAGDRFANAQELLAALEACATARTPSRRASADDGIPASAAESVRGDTALTRGAERRQATVVACTIDGQDAIVERLAPDQADAVLAQLRDAASEVAAHFGGIVNQFAGDDLVMLFGIPTAHDEDAVRGVRAALALRERVGEIAASLGGRFSAGLRLRAGVHVGAVVAQRSRDAARSFRITGQPADIAARLAAAADSDTILVSPETRRMVAPFVHTEAAHPVAVHGDGTSVVPHRLLRASDVRSRLEGALLAGLTPFVGRTRERLTLRHQIDATVRGEGQFTIVVGEAGAGKSRLLHELRDMAAAQELRVVVGRCDAYGRSTAFLPFIDAAIDILRLPEGGSIPERHEAVVAGARAIDRSLEESLALYLALLAIPSAAHPVPELLHGDQFQSAMLGAIAALFTLGSRSAPAVLLLEDWHWADDASHAALMQLAEIVPAFPLLIVVTARPDASVDWGTGEHQTLLHLAPLDGTASGEIACAVFGANRIAPALVAQLHERTGGNSFFLEEVCVALREEGSVTVQDGQAAASDSAVTVHVPETVQGVLRTRMDRLDQDTGEILRVAAVIGREFTRGVLEDVVESTAELGRALERLKSSGLVQQTAIVPEPAYRFKHALTQEVAYDSLLEHQRTSLHAAVGHAIVARYAARLDEHVDLLAHHFSSAEAWEDAVRHGVLAADRASGLGRNADALQTLERVEEWALHLLDDDARRDLLADVLFRQERLSEMLGLRTRQLAIVESLIALLAPHGPSARLAQVYLRQGDANTLLNRYEAAERALETALRISRDRADGPGERNALRSIALLRSHQGRHADALERIEQVLALGQHAGDTRAQAGDLATMGNVLRALGELPRALSVLEAALERTEVSDNRTRYGALLHVIGNVYRDMGKADTALEYFWRTRAFMPDTVYASFTLPSIAHIQLQQGHVAQAIRTYEESVAMNRKVSYADGLALSCRALGEVLVGLARNDEAVPYLTESATLFAQIEDWQNEALMWRRLATVYEQLQRPELARATWERMRAIHHANENSACEVDALEGIARAERQLAAPVEDVVARYDEALSIALRQGDRPRELAIRNSLGIAHWQRGAYGDAVRQYELALRVCRETGDRVHEGLILNSLGACLNRLRRWDEAQTTLAEAIRVTAETGEMKLQAHALAALAEVCIGRGRVDDAIVHLTASLAFRRLLDDRRGEGWMQQRLAVAYGMNATTMSQAAVARDEALRIASEIDDSALQEAVQQLGPPQFTSPTSVNQANAALHHRT